MNDATLQTEQLQAWLSRLQAGDRTAPDELLRHVCGRLESLTRKLRRDYPGLRRWAETDDVLQGAMLRLLRALKATCPADSREFFALAATQIRRELLDLARHYYGPHGLGANHRSDPAEGSVPPLHERADDTHDPGRLAEWWELHQHIDALPAPERSVVDLLFYHGLSQVQAASVLGVTIRTVQRRWQSALLQLHPRVRGETRSPGGLL